MAGVFWSWRLLFSPRRRRAERVKLVLYVLVLDDNRFFLLFGALSRRKMDFECGGSSRWLRRWARRAADSLLLVKMRMLDWFRD